MLCGEVGCMLFSITIGGASRGFRLGALPCSFDDFVEIALGRSGAGKNHLGWSVKGALAWSIWTTRNDLVFNHKTCPNVLTNIVKSVYVIFHSGELSCREGVGKARMLRWTN